MMRCDNLWNLYGRAWIGATWNAECQFAVQASGLVRELVETGPIIVLFPSSSAEHASRNSAILESRLGCMHESQIRSIHPTPRDNS